MTLTTNYLADTTKCEVLTLSQTGHDIRNPNCEACIWLKLEMK